MEDYVKQYQIFSQLSEKVQITKTGLTLHETHILYKSLLATKNIFTDFQSKAPKNKTNDINNNFVLC